MCARRRPMIYTHVFWPTHDGEGPEAGREPRVQDVFVLLESEGLAVGESLGALRRLFQCPPNHPVLAIDFLSDSEQAGRTHARERSRPAPRLQR